MVIALYQEYRPALRLLPFVECGWVRSGSATEPIRVMPDGCLDLFVTPDGSVTIAGPATTFYDLRPDQESVLAGLRLRPGVAAAVIGQPASEFTDSRVPVDSILGIAGHRVAEKVLTAETPSDRLATLQSVLTDYLANAVPMVDRAVERAVVMLQRRPDWPVPSLAVAVDLSERQLRRRFETAVGYGPKRFGRIFRFQHLLDLIHACGGRVHWAELAIAAGYADQSHMINECLALAGMSPIALPGGAGGAPGDVSVSSNTTSAQLP